MALYGKKRNGFTLIEALVLIAIFSISVITFYRVFGLSTYHIIEAKKRLAAVSLANERIEQIRNISYDDIGTPTGSPSGSIIADETVVINNVQFRILTDIRYVIDPADGIAPPIDSVPTDYKRVQIFILWGDGSNQSVPEATAKGPAHRKQRVDITSQFVTPGGLESLTGEGILSINVLDSNGLPIGGASVNIYHPTAGSPTINYTGVTDATGNLTYAAPPAPDYRLTVSKNGGTVATTYETVKTEVPFDGSASGPGSYDPTDEHQSVLESAVTTTTIITDFVSDFEINVRDPFCQVHSPGVAVDFDIFGGRVIGTDPNNGGAPVYTLETSLTTDTGGDVEVYTDTDADGVVETTGDDQASPGLYTVALNEPGYILWKLEPGNDVLPNATVAGSGITACNFIMLANTFDGALIEVVDSTTTGDPVPVISAVVRLQNTLLGYDISQITDKYGTTFFPEDANVPLINGTVYDVRVSADGYFDKNATITISGLQTPTIDLTPLP